MTTRGQFGEPPYWYLMIRAARYLGVPPWELEDQPIEWFWRALIAESAENEAERDAQRRQISQARHHGR